MAIQPYGQEINGTEKGREMTCNGRCREREEESEEGMIGQLPCASDGPSRRSSTPPLTRISKLKRIELPLSRHYIPFINYATMW